MKSKLYRVLMVAVVAALAVTVVLPLGAVGAQPVRNALLTDIPVQFTNAAGETVNALLDITGFALNEAGQLTASGQITDTAGNVLGTFTGILADLFDPDGGKCDILFLDLGPIFLDVLGLEVDLSAIQLDVNAVPGPGNLLGNLLCAVAGLLDNGGPLDGLLNLLNQINRLLA